MSTPVEGTETVNLAGARTADFDIPPDRGAYRLTYEQSGQGPYDHRSSTTWSFRSAAPDDSFAVPIPLLVVDYELPLDTSTARPATRPP